MAGKEKTWYLKHGALSAGAGLGATVLLCMLFAFLTLRGIVPEAWLTPIVYLCVFLSAILTGMVSAQGTAKRTAMSLGAAAAYLLLLPLLGLALYDSLCMKRMAYLSLATALGAAVSLVGGQKGRGRKRRGTGEHNRKRRVKR